MKITISKVYNIDKNFLSYLFDNMDKMPTNLTDFEEYISECVQDFCEDYIYYENTEELYRKVKSLLN